MFTIQIYKNSTTQDIQEFLLNHKNSSFFQSGIWVQFNKDYFHKNYYFISVKDGNEIKLASLILENNLFLNYKYLYCPSGPIFDFNDIDAFVFFISKIKEIIGGNIIFLRVEPKIDYSKIRPNKRDSYEVVKNLFLKQLGFKISIDQKQPETSLVIDLENRTEEAVLQQMKEKGRYNIKIAERNDIIVRKTNDIDSFYSLMQETTKRDGFFANDKEYYSKLLNYSDNIYLYSAYYENKVIASAIAAFYGDKVIYYYGASTSDGKYRKMMAPYILQWSMIKDALSMHYKYYDFLGISPSIDNIDNNYYIFNGLKEYIFKNKNDAERFITKHKFYGITQFKTRFGGRTVSYVGAIDKVYNAPIYYILDFLKILRRVLRKITKRRI